MEEKESPKNNPQEYMGMLFRSGEPDPKGTVFSKKALIKIAMKKGWEIKDLENGEVEVWGRVDFE